MHHEHPELVRDQYWDEVFPSELPYTVASEQFRDEPPLHSTDKILISRQDSEAVSPPVIKLDDLGECLVCKLTKSKFPPFLALISYFVETFSFLIGRTTIHRIPTKNQWKFCLA